MTDVFAKNIAMSANEAAKLTPRAEFRVFGKDIIENVKERMWECKAVLYKARIMPEETYILSKNTNEANVKVRDGLLDIKTKVGETPEGYEIFQPKGKFQFPVKKDELATILENLKIEQNLTKEEYTFDEFCEMARNHNELALVHIEKKRFGFSVNDVICEYAYVWMNGALIETACCESEDYNNMKSVVEALGLANMPNTNYLKAAKKVVGF